MNPFAAVSSGLANFANFRNRSSPAEAWWFAAFVAAGCACAAYLDVFRWGGVFADYSVTPPVVERLYGGATTGTIWGALLLPASTAAAVRRLRDAGARPDRVAGPTFLGLGLLVLSFFAPTWLAATGGLDLPLRVASGWATLSDPHIGALLLCQVPTALAPLLVWLLCGRWLVLPSRPGATPQAASSQTSLS